MNEDISLCRVSKEFLQWDIVFEAMWRCVKSRVDYRHLLNNNGFNVHVCGLGWIGGQFWAQYSFHVDYAISL
jgi:hypothetical protein